MTTRSRRSGEPYDHDTTAGRVAWKNGDGCSWARIVATVLGALNILSTLFTVLGANTTPLSAIFTIINVVLAIVILVLLWRKESGNLYAARSAPQHG